MNRRTLLALLSGAAATGLTAPAGAAIAGRRTAAGPNVPDLAGMRRIGRRYLELHPQDLEAVATLRGRLRERPEPDRAGLLRLAGEDVRRDLDSHEVVTIDGWVVPRTMARLCAAVALG